eukprot:CAMPEP_0172187200 /NCGR_PEP_ID=MMETSP1050-20130122/21213_1 /TAXON_ID=233186 /ORGANISM="Cryptomonas curvata, Strain CCAP979/52" /LENGTH=171 /DNA_ID=CAMNT_0012861511 /DNA_START=62 /DNA_END=574 /DNA_ORIENTATION=-
MASQLSQIAVSATASSAVAIANMDRCGLIDTGSINSLPELTKSLEEFSQQEMVSAIAQNLNLNSCFDYFEPAKNIRNSSEKARVALEVQKRLFFCCSVVAKQMSAELDTKGPDAIEKKFTVKLAGNSDDAYISPERESYENYSNYGKEKNVLVFTHLSSLCTSTIIRPDIW